MGFREIDRFNYWDCMSLTVDDSQKWFVADNKRSLVEAAYEDGLYTLGVYHGDTMVGFILFLLFFILYSKGTVWPIIWKIDTS